jgi:hypothetical protein
LGQFQIGLSLVQSRALCGLEAALVIVEVHFANGLPRFSLLGLADVEVTEARGTGPVRNTKFRSGIPAHAPDYGESCAG